DPPPATLTVRPGSYAGQRAGPNRMVYFLPPPPDTPARAGRTNCESTSTAGLDSAGAGPFHRRTGPSAPCSPPPRGGTIGGAGQRAPPSGVLLGEGGMRFGFVLGCLVSVLPATPVLADQPPDGPPAEKGTVRFAPVDGDRSTPERYRLTGHEFP